MLLKFFGMSEPSEATRRRRNWRARSDGELLRFESMNDMRKLAAQVGKLGATYHPSLGSQ